ncbi:MAG: hypothetical protein IJV07_03120 [Alphaproteobacteria bacterium]|nr:hypothetical protein [Alphaproteobacteria bacterium]
MPILQNRTYCIKPTTKEGFFVLIIRARDEDAKGASIMYDGRSNALFLRRPKETILLDYINPSIQKALVESAEVGVVELDIITEDVTRTYKVPMRRVDEVFVATYGTSYSVC